MPVIDYDNLPEGQDPIDALREAVVEFVDHGTKDDGLTSEVDRLKAVASGLHLMINAVRYQTDVVFDRLNELTGEDEGEDIVEAAHSANEVDDREAATRGESDDLGDDDWDEED
jgi:hypothetical protein